MRTTSNSGGRGTELTSKKLARDTHGRFPGKETRGAESSGRCQLSPRCYGKTVCLSSELRGLLLPTRAQPVQLLRTTTGHVVCPSAGTDELPPASSPPRCTSYRPLDMGTWGCMGKVEGHSFLIAKHPKVHPRGGREDGRERARTIATHAA